MSKLLLHTCCAPCTMGVIDDLQKEQFEIKAFFYNPNIRPNQEYEKRLLTMEYYATIIKLKVIFEPIVDAVMRPEISRCEQCYELRLKKTARFAKDNGFDCFSTTLLVSPFQKHDLLRQLGKRIADQEQIEFIYKDFRPNFKAAQEKAKAMNIYRQKYCGCLPKPLRREVNAQAGQ